MSNPDYQSIMLPLLQSLEDKKEHSLKDIVEWLASKFKLTDTDRKELLPSGHQLIFNNRVGWAKTYLSKAGLIDLPKRASLVITEKGLNVLKEKPKLEEA